LYIFIARQNRSRNAMSVPPGFAEKVARYSDAELARVIGSAADYTPEAMGVVMAEWDRRQLTADQVAPALARAEERAETLAAPSPARSQTWRGTGLVCYGREFAPGAGYITTQWLCVFLLPLVPVRSFRLDRDSGGIASGVPLHFPQIGRTYAFLLVAAVCIVAGFWFASKLSDTGHDFAAVAVMGVAVLAPVFLVQGLRRKARQHRPGPP
jgi:hypothetical protein